MEHSALGELADAGCTLLTGGCERLGGEVLCSPLDLASFLADRLSLQCKFYHTWSTARGTAFGVTWEAFNRQWHASAPIQMAFGVL